MLVGFLFSIITNLGYSEAFKFQLYFFRSKRRARRAQRTGTSPAAAGRFNSAVSDSNFEGCPMANHQPPALRTSLWN